MAAKKPSKKVSWKDSKGKSHTALRTSPSYKRHLSALKGARNRK